MGRLGAFTLIAFGFLFAFGCGRTDFRAFDELSSLAGEGGTDGGTAGTNSGARPNGGTGNRGGTTSAGGFSGTGGTSFTGGVSGTGACGGLAACAGTCVDLLNDPEHCGRCFAACDTDAYCVNGTCSDPCPGSTLCFGICTDTTSDPFNCGRCGLACAARPLGNTCVEGECRCPGRQAACSSTCTDLQTDRFNCGTCGLACANNQLCADGVCRLDCPSDFAVCDGECRNLRADPDNCGACGAACARLEVCNDGRCDTSCGNLTSCNGTCRDLEHDPRHCGSCNNACAMGQVCADGACSLVCGPGITNCNGVCRDLRVDSQNCGACGNRCAARESCSNGMCTPVSGDPSYTLGTSPLSFLNACSQPGAATYLRGVDDDAVPIMLPFTFRYYGAATQTGWVSSNGVFGFGPGLSIEYFNQCTFPGTVANAVLAFWDDLIMRPGYVCLATIGAAPSRMFIATWNGVTHIEQPMSSLTFSVVLSEGTNTIDVLYENMSGGSLALGASASIGLASSSAYSLECCDRVCVTSNTGKRYTPR